MKTIDSIRNMEELKEAVNIYAEIERELARQEALMNKELDEIKRRFDVKNAQAKANREALKTIIQGYADENKDALITDDKRSNEALAEIGLSRKEKDTFYIEIKTENLL